MKTSRIPSSALLFSLLLLLSQFGCKSADPILGKWKVVRMQADGHDFAENRLGEYYYEFDKKGKLTIFQEGNVIEKVYEREEGYLIDPEAGETGKLKIEKLEEEELVISGISENGKDFILHFQRVKP